MYSLTRPGSHDSELEALQTDVMRFVAILGLCLAAIFSLVQSVAQEQQGEKQIATASVTEVLASVSRDLSPSPPPAKEVARIPRDQASHASKPLRLPVTPEPKPTAPAASPELGYTLEFDSPEVLLALLQAQSVQVIATLNDKVWISRGKPLFIQAEPPAQYHRMEAATVPEALRQGLRNVAGAAEPDWGVVLPAQLQEQLRGYANRPGGGALVIQADASVRLEAAQNQAASTR
ncbi:hypothetical protein EYC98_15590 [Halieaceae bacterium IMCC14734]|uniref:Uncharacterized protein n=1 Tax=Candidatus Litorirhabdus singularis TaxID=2518993 RepID=A0ABT3TIY2_9GAMM|nr:hypothetical protein [Candidatus Litorirhabdus singularis]MCX2982285.1 hypothetical protein [Candidatus Litorirhabdus singularis]